MNRIKNILYRCGWMILIILVCLSGVYFLKQYKESRSYIQSRAGDFSTKYAQKERSLEVILDSLTAVLNSNPAEISDVLWQKIPSDRYEIEGLAAFVWHKDSLVYWSHNTIPVPEIWEEGLFEAPFMRMKTIWVVPEVREIKDYKLVGMILIKWVYPYENNLLENSFHPSFGLPNPVKISTQPLPDSFQVVSKKGDTLFYLLFDESIQSKLTEVTIPSVLYWIVFILLLTCPYYWLSDKSDHFRRRAVIFLIFAGIALRILMQTFMWPDVWYQSEWFDPKHLAVVYLFPSLGDLLVTILVVAALTFYFCRYYRFSSPVSHRYIRQRQNRHIGYAFWLLLVMFLYILIMDIIERIVMNSNIDATNSLMFTYVSLVVYFSIALLLTSSVLLFEKWIEYVREDFPYNTFRALILSISFITVLFSLVLRQTDLFIASLAFPFIALIIARVKYTSVHGYRYVELVLLVFVFALYTTGLVYYYGESRSRQDRNILAMNLATERDEVAEYLLSELDPVLLKDSVLHEMMRKDDFSVEEINAYLTRQYFYGYWEKYSFQFIMCHSDDNLLLDPPSQQETPCHSFFYNITVQKGIPLPNSNFYFIQNRNGRMTYLGSLNFEQADRSENASLFIELTSKYYTYEIGYPELLIERKISQNLSLSNYSYARYYQNLLIDNYGDFAYHRTDQIYGDIQPGTFKNVDFNDYHHTVYNAGDDTLFVLSTPIASYWTLLITLSYVFLLFVLLASIFFIASHRKILYDLIALNFQNKIQYSVLALMILFTIIITGVSGSFLFQQSQRKHRDVITQKLQSIAIELNNAVGSEDWEYISRDQIESLLFDKARVYSTDINLYSPNGSLLASSRPEIFSKGLLGMQISPQIFQRLHFQGEMTIIGEEQVGSLKYISAYVPLTDQDNKVRGILNVPYFMQQNILTQEISTLLVTVLNLFILLFLLSVILSVIISRQLTHPLRILQQYLGRIQLNTQAEILEYSGKDEIGDLVRSYNHMVEELAHNVDRLAKSERESAWREMAKQIAHEIKNPLTPMKLNVQHIRRAKDQHNENFDVMFDRVTTRLMEQIDLLSDIASQFSNFASMSVTHQEKVNVVDRLDQVVQLFMNSQVEFVTEYDPSEVIWVWGDGKRITQVFTNLIKNGIQAIPPERAAVITVKVLKHGRQVWIRITDNGNGIPEEMMDKIFEPNFTTKTSGMGLGLAIVKTIVESLQGKITFTTEPGKGSSFLVRFSVYVEEN